MERYGSKYLHLHRASASVVDKMKRAGISPQVRKAFVRRHDMVLAFACYAYCAKGAGTVRSYARLRPLLLACLRKARAAFKKDKSVQRALKKVKAVNLIGKAHSAVTLQVRRPCKRKGLLRLNSMKCKHAAAFFKKLTKIKGWTSLPICADSDFLW